MSNDLTPFPYQAPQSPQTAPKGPPAGWYPDPQTRVGRYWDGLTWTDRMWPDGLLPGPGWRSPEGSNGPWYFDGRNYNTLPAPEAWRQIVKKLRSPRQVFETVHVQATLHRLAEWLEARIPSPWLQGDALGAAVVPDLLKYGNLLARDITPPRFARDDWFSKDLEHNIREALMVMISNRYTERQAALRSHDPLRRERYAAFVPAGPAPGPLRYGVSHEGAEHLVAEWMVYLGEVDAEVTRFSGDGGIDVSSSHYVAQVKNYGSEQSVGSSDLRELQGVASMSGRRPIFFTSGKYPSGGIEFANQVGMALFRYNAVEGSLSGENPLAVRLLETGL